MTPVASIKIQRSPFSVRYRLAESLTWSKREMKAYLYKQKLNKEALTRHRQGGCLALGIFLIRGITSLETMKGTLNTSLTT